MFSVVFRPDSVALSFFPFRPLLCFHFFLIRLLVRWVVVVFAVRIVHAVIFFILFNFFICIIDVRGVFLFRFGLYDGVLWCVSGFVLWRGVVWCGVM